MRTFQKIVLGTKMTFRFYDLEKHGNAGSGENKKYKKGKLVLALKTKKRTTKGKIEFIAHCNEMSMKGE